MQGRLNFVAILKKNKKTYETAFPDDEKPLGALVLTKLVESLLLAALTLSEKLFFFLLVVLFVSFFLFAMCVISLIFAICYLCCFLRFG